MLDEPAIQQRGPVDGEGAEECEPGALVVALVPESYDSAWWHREVAPHVAAQRVDSYRLPCRLTFEGSRTPLTQHTLTVLLFDASGQLCADPVTHPTRAQILAWNDATARSAPTAAQDGPGDAICAAVEMGTYPGERASTRG
jgi:hypothetical protein